MFRGFYTAASGMLAQQRRTEMLSNNMANVNTPGYKADQTVLRAFPEMLLKRIDKTKVPVEGQMNTTVGETIGPLHTGVYLQETIPLFMQGDLRETEQKTDLALVDVNMPLNNNNEKGSVFFTIQHPSGELLYTRNGDFTIDAQGFLTTASGLYVLDDQGNQIRLSSDQFAVNDQGIVIGVGGETARLGIGYTNNPYALIKEGDGLFRTENGNQLANAFNAQGVQFKLQQGFLEGSNVDTSRTMTDMMTSYRAFEANQKVLQAYDRSMEKAVNEIGKL